MNRRILGSLSWVAILADVLGISVVLSAVGTAHARPAQAASSPAGQQAVALLANGDMEAGDRTPLGWEKGATVPGVRSTWDRATGHDSKRSLCLHKTAQKYFPIAQWYQVVPNVGTMSKLKVSAWVKAVSAAKGTIAVQFISQGGETKHQWVAYIGAKNSDDPPVSHDWTEYTGIADIPPGTEKLGIALQIHGPGKIWFDDVRAEFVSDGTATEKVEREDPLSDVADVPAQDLRAGGDANKRYFLIGATKVVKPPAAGYALLIVLPGGDGSADFHPFIRRMYKNALDENWLIAQLVAPQWDEKQAKAVVWPTERARHAAAKFTTEQFIEAVASDVRVKVKIDRKRVFLLGWSSGGPPCYAMALRKGTPVAGAFIAMSVFKPEQLPPLENAKGRAFYLLQSPDDKVTPMRFAEAARKDLETAGAKVHLQQYPGGHGWHGNVFKMIADGVKWLDEQQVAKP